MLAEELVRARCAAEPPSTTRRPTTSGVIVMFMPAIELCVPGPAACRAPLDAAATTASARIESRTSEVFRFFMFLPSRLTRLIRPTAEYGSIDDFPTRDDVERARATIGDRLARTPLLRNRTIGARLKCELFQRTGSFKVRGALNKISIADAPRRRPRRDRDQRRATTPRPSRSPPRGRASTRSS